jgi:hypothetical protein
MVLVIMMIQLMWLGVSSPPRRCHDGQIDVAGCAIAASSMTGAYGFESEFAYPSAGVASYKY